MNKQELRKRLELTPEEIGDNVDLLPATYPCSDGSSVMVGSVDKLLQAQLNKVLNELDLAWIDRERELPPENNKCILWALYQKGWLESQQAMRLAGFTHSVIPLTDLKEVKDEPKSR